MNKKIIYYPFFLIFLSLIIPVSISAAFTFPEASKAVFTNAASVPVQTKEKDNPGTVISVFNSSENKTEEKNLEEYLIGVVTAEMPASYEQEALKAQAVAARTYILNKSEATNPDHKEAAVCTNPSHCKGYLSSEEAGEKWGADWKEKYFSKIQSAVNDTAGEYMAYDGKAIEAFFFALSNGETENSGEVWGTDLPYLVSCASGFDTSAPNFISTAEFTAADFNNRLKSLRSDFPPSAAPTVSDAVLSEGGRIKTVKINGTQFSGTEIRSAFGLKSTDFSIKAEGEKIIFTVKGNGHGVGMSQYGANCLAKNGATYKEILAHYYKDIEIITK